MIRLLVRFLKSAIFAIFFFAIVLSLCIWFLGPLLAIGDWRPWDSLFGRIGTLIGLWIFSFLLLFIILWRRRRKDRAMTEDIVEATAEEDDPADSIVKAELGDLKDKLKQAMVALRKSKGGRKHLYELPWYVMIGPPGAGKTTAIVNSGLNFPLAEEMGKTSIGGVGGTRNCDWWFTENAVLIDTAGRYTTQESDAVADNASWLGFLGLLKKHRPRQPVNGAIIAISLSDLSLQDAETQAGHARAVRRRLHELREKLGVRFPVYVLFTKADMIAGFSEFYDTLGKEDRAQVWGFTFPMTKTKGEVSPVANFDEEFGALLGRLNSQSLERLQQETDHQRRSLIAGFPAQLASVRQVAKDFLGEVFQDNRYEHRHLLRGVYLTSGTQEGTPIDRLMMNMAKAFGIGRQAIGSGQGTGRSYFLTRLFEGVMFPEAGLVSADDKAERRYRVIKWASITAAVVAFLATGALWTRSYIGNQALIAETREGISTFQAQAATIPGSPIGDTDLPAVVPALNTLRDLPANPTTGEWSTPTSLTWGLYQGDVLGSQAAQTYRAALNQHLLPRLLLRLEEQMQANMDNADFLYESLKMYLMLGGQGPMSQDLLVEWMKLDWEILYSGESRAPLRADLEGHLNALLSNRMEEVGLNGPLVERAQNLLLQMPMAERIYAGIINSPAAKDLPNWRVGGNGGTGGPNIGRAMVRSSGKPLTEGIEGVFTRAGFRTVFLNEAVDVAERVQRESWVLGPRGQAEQNDEALNVLARDILDLYYNDFISRYDGMLSDLDIIPLESESHAVEVTNVLSGPTSPIFNVLSSIAEETQLTQPLVEVNTDALEAGAGELLELEAQALLTGRANRMREILQASATSPTGQTEPEPGQYVEDRFQWLQDLVLRPEGQESQLDGLLRILTEVYQGLNKMVISGQIDEAGQGALLRFQEATSLLPGPMQKWSKQIVVSSSGLTSDNTPAVLRTGARQPLPVHQGRAGRRGDCGF